MLGILTLDTTFPRIKGDVGCAETFPFPVRHLVVTGATLEDVVHRREATLLPRFIDAGRKLAGEGCEGITTTCGFLLRWQAALTEALPVPVLTSPLLQVAMIERCLPHGQHVGIVTHSAVDLPPDALKAAGVNPYAPIEGIDPASYFGKTTRHGSATLERSRMSTDVVAAARRLAGAHHTIGAIVLESANMPPYRDDVEAAIGLPVFDAAQLITWFHTGLAGTTPRYGRRNLW
jgi:hypothetical protein